MMKMTKRILSLVLALTVLASVFVMVPVSAGSTDFSRPYEADALVKVLSLENENFESYDEGYLVENINGGIFGGGNNEGRRLHRGWETTDTSGDTKQVAGSCKVVVDPTTGKKYLRYEPDMKYTEDASGNKLYSQVENYELRFENSPISGATATADMYPDTHSFAYYTVDFDFMMPELNMKNASGNVAGHSMTNLYYAHLSRGGDFDGKTSPGVMVGIRYDGALAITDSGNSMRAIASKVNAGQWYNLKIKVDVAKRKYHIFLDGKEVLAPTYNQNGEGFDFGGPQSPSNFWTSDYAAKTKAFNYQWIYGKMPACYDNIKVYREPYGKNVIFGSDFSEFEDGYVFEYGKDQEFLGMYFDGSNRVNNQVKVGTENFNKILVVPANSLLRARSDQLKEDNSSAINQWDVSKKYLIEFKLKLTSTDTGNILELSGFPRSNYGFILKESGGKLYVTRAKIGDVGGNAGAATTDTALVNVRAGSWYTVKMYIDFTKTFTQNVTTGNYPGTYNRIGMMDIYINDYLYGDDLGFGYIPNNVDTNATAGIATANLAEPVIISGNKAEFYMDDFYISKAQTYDVWSDVDINNYISTNYPTNGLPEGKLTLPSVPAGYTLSFAPASTNPGLAADGTVTVGTDTVAPAYIRLNHYLDNNKATLQQRFSFWTPIDYSLLYDQKVPFEINSITFRNGADGSLTYGPTSNGAISAAVFKNNTSSAANVIAAVYNDGKLVDSRIIENPANDAETVINMNLPKVYDEDVEVKFFVWSADGKLTPLDAETNVTSEKKRLFILSDSIYAEYPVGQVTAGGYTGIGKKLKEYFDPNKVEIINWAVCGGTMPSHVKNGYFQKALNGGQYVEVAGAQSNGYNNIDFESEVFPGIQKGDYVLLSFAHNDQKEFKIDQKAEGPYSVGSYQYYIQEYVKAIRSKGAIPFFVTAIPRCYWDAEAGKLADSHAPAGMGGNYITAAIQAANYLKMPVIDLNAYTMEEFSKGGTEESAKAYYATGVAAPVAGVFDRTHVNNLGATVCAEYIVDQIKALNLPIAEGIIDPQ